MRFLAFSRRDGRVENCLVWRSMISSPVRFAHGRGDELESRYVRDTVSAAATGIFDRRSSSRTALLHHLRMPELRSSRGAPRFLISSSPPPSPFWIAFIARAGKLALVLADLRLHL
jgi:hypothetical protein